MTLPLAVAVAAQAVGSLLGRQTTIADEESDGIKQQTHIVSSFATTLHFFLKAI